MHARLFIVTYDNPRDLDATMTSLFESDWHGHDLEVIIINNHSRFELRPEHAARCRVIHNAGRPDFSTGHLARNWNQALIHGFESLVRPTTQFVITAQNDTLFHPRWFHQLLELHERYSFITFGTGDNFCSYTAAAVRAIGLWDERFCGIGYQEADYFIRAYIDNYERSCINDVDHERTLNPHPGEPLARRLHPPGQLDHHHLKSARHHTLNKNLFYKKWGPDLHPERWHFFLSGPLQGRRSRIENYVLYPFFELEIDRLGEKNFHADFSGVAFFDASLYFAPRPGTRTITPNQPEPS